MANNVIAGWRLRGAYSCCFHCVDFGAIWLFRLPFIQNVLWHRLLNLIWNSFDRWHNKRSEDYDWLSFEAIVIIAAILSTLQLSLGFWTKLFSCFSHLNCVVQMLAGKTKKHTKHELSHHLICNGLVIQSSWIWKKRSFVLYQLAALYELYVRLLAQTNIEIAFNSSIHSNRLINDGGQIIGSGEPKGPNHKIL